MQTEMNKYYEYRKKFRDLYAKEPCSSNDLGSSILEIKDKNKCVVSISMDLNAYYIEVEFDESTDPGKIKKVTDSIVRRIGYFLSANLDSIEVSSEEERDDIERTLNEPIALYCDYFVIGNMLKINL